jgi:SAM-dependent methyltransferase
VTVPPQFDQYAGTYETALNSALSVTGDNSAFYAETRIALLKQFLGKYFATDVGKILDFGCGTGSATPFFRKHFAQAEIIGVDVSSESIAVARQRFESEAATFHPLRTSDAESIKSVSVAFVNGVFHHIPLMERDFWLNWIYEKLAPNGVLALFENNPWNPGTRFVMSRCEFDGDAICLSPIETKRRMYKAGLRILGIHHLFFFPSFLQSFRRIEPCLRWIPLGGQYVCLGRK